MKGEQLTFDFSPKLPKLSYESLKKLYSVMKKGDVYYRAMTTLEFLETNTLVFRRFTDDDDE